MAFEKPVETRAVTTEIVKRINEDMRRIRAIEQRIGRVEDRVRMIEETTLSQMDDLGIALERISQKISNLTERLTTIDNETLRINKELNKMATKTEMKHLETFVDIVNPITSKFVTRDEVERILEEREKK